MDFEKFTPPTSSRIINKKPFFCVGCQVQKTKQDFYGHQRSFCKKCQILRGKSYNQRLHIRITYLEDAVKFLCQLNRIDFPPNPVSFAEIKTGEDNLGL